MIRLPIFKTHFTLAFFALLLTILLPINTFAQEIIWKKSFGSVINSYESVTAVSDGIVVAGRGAGFNYADWEGVLGKGGSDAIVLKYDNKGNVIWKKNFGGESYDTFFSVTEVPEGVVAVGYSNDFSFNTGDWEGITNKGAEDAIIVKFDKKGNVIWKKNFGGIIFDHFCSVTTVSDGIVAVGHSEGSLDTGDWEGIASKGDSDAIIVKYDFDGKLIWKRNFGGKGRNGFSAVAKLSNSIFAVGRSDYKSFGNGDWEGVEGKGAGDAILVKYDNDGNVVWKKSFGGEGGDAFESVITTSDGIITVGFSFEKSFGTGDWKGFVAKGKVDAIIVKFDFAGNVVWKNNFGGIDDGIFESVTEVIDGFVAVGNAYFISFNTGDLEGITGKGKYDAIVVKYDKEGNVVWKNGFGGISQDWYSSVARVGNSIVAVGVSYCDSFGTGDWEGIECRGGHAMDAIIIKYADGEIGIDEPEKDVTEISVFPNPTAGQLQITSHKLRITGVEIYDVYGRKLYEQKSNLTVLLSYDLTVFPAGIYIIKISTEKGIVNKKIIKQ